MIYVIEMEGTRYVKIGYSRDVASLGNRVKNLQTGSCKPLAIVHTEEGTRKDERKYHRLLGDIRGTGEWFYLGNHYRLFGMNLRYGLNAAIKKVLKSTQFGIENGWKRE